MGACGSALDSPSAYISVYPTISVHPGVAYLSAGSRASFKVSTSAIFYPSYKWYTNSHQTLVGTSAPPYTTGPLSAAMIAMVEVYSGTARTDSYAGEARICNGPRSHSNPTTRATDPCT